MIRPDGTLRWSMQLVTDERNDLNASPALGAESVYLAGESGEVFSVPYDHCLRPENTGDARCRLGGLVAALIQVALHPAPFGLQVVDAALHLLQVALEGVPLEPTLLKFHLKP